MSAIQASTRVLMLLGDPVHHSLSPIMQNAALRQTDLDAVYVAQRTPAEELGAVLRAQAFAGGGGNITVPHKEAAATMLDHPSDAVRRTGACNTFWAAEGKVAGDNTDLEGFRRAVAEGFGDIVKGGRVLLMGGGGAARAALAAMVADDVGEVVIYNRSRDRARTIARRIGGERVRVADDVSQLEGQSFALVVNATSLGRQLHDGDPISLAGLGRVGAVFDMNYRLGGTSLQTTCHRLRIDCRDGRGMLVHQGAVAFERWTGVPAPLKVMRRALDAALEAGSSTSF